MNATTAWYNASKATFTIKTKEELAGLAQLVNGGNDFNGKTIELGANIVLNDTQNWASWNENTTGLDSWTPIGKSYSFNGTFDGKGCTISGIYINIRSKFQGLFGVNGGTIKNLGVVDSYIAGSNNTGCLVGQNNGEISYCYAMGNAYGATCTGGLAGQNSGKISYSYATGNMTIIASNNYLGGLVGQNSGTISYCFATGSLSNTSGQTGCFNGGLVGENSGKISDCYSKVNVVIGNNGPHGGLVAKNTKGSINNCYATGYTKNTAFASPPVGGLVGVNEGGTISNSYYDIQTSGQSDKGKGEGKTTSEMWKQSTYKGWDFNKVWAICPGSHPSFRFLKPNPQINDLSYAIPTNHIYNGKAQGIGDVTLKSPLSGVSFVIVKYNNSTTLPINAGTYTVTADIAESATYSANLLTLGSYTIAKRTPAKDDFIFNCGQHSVEQKQGVTVTLKSPLLDFGAITIKYNGSTTIPTEAGTYDVTVDVAEGTNNKQETGISLGSYTIIKKIPNLKISDLNYTIPTNHAYNGKAQGIGDVKPATGITGLGAITVKYNMGECPIKAGTYTVTADIAESTTYFASSIELGSYAIAKRTPAKDDFCFCSSQDGVSVILKSPLLDFGAITVKYNGSTTPSTEPGTYDVTIDVAEGTNNKHATGISLGSYTIIKKIPNLKISDLNYTIPTNHTYNGKAQGIGDVKPANGVTGLGAITVKYNMGECPIKAGTYTVTADIAESATYFASSIELGSYAIAKKTPAKDDFIFNCGQHSVEQKRGVTVTLKSPLLDFGSITVKYSGSTTPPNGAGTYDITVDVAEGTNNKSATGILLGSYTILDKDCCKKSSSLIEGLCKLIRRIWCGFK